MKSPESITGRLLIVQLVFLIYTPDKTLTLATKELLPYLRYHAFLKVNIRTRPTHRKLFLSELFWRIYYNEDVLDKVDLGYLIIFLK